MEDHFSSFTSLSPPTFLHLLASSSVLLSDSAKLRKGMDHIGKKLGHPEMTVTSGSCYLPDVPLTFYNSDLGPCFKATPTPTSTG